jgi:hypothetical protein
MKTLLSLCILTLFTFGCGSKNNTSGGGAVSDTGKKPAPAIGVAGTGGNPTGSIITPLQAMSPIQLTTASASPLLVVCYFTGPDFPDAHVDITSQWSLNPIPAPTFLKANGAGVVNGTIVINPNNAWGYSLTPVDANSRAFNINAYETRGSNGTPYDKVKSEPFSNSAGKLEFARMTYYTNDNKDSLIVMITDPGIF